MPSEAIQEGQSHTLTHFSCNRVVSFSCRYTLPYQTLAASVLHMVAKGELKLSLARVD
jgi:hypothetical protein